MKAESTKGREGCMECDISAEETDSSDSVSFCVYSKYQYPSLCEMMERTGISNRYACKVVNACLEDMGLNTQEELLMPSNSRSQMELKWIMWHHKVVSQKILLVKLCQLFVRGTPLTPCRR